MFNIDTLKQGINLKESKSLIRIANNGQELMYKYLSGADDNSTYTAQNVKYIMEMHGNIDWNKVEDKSNALFSIGYSDQGNIIGLLTNTNALLQDMLIYSDLATAKKNLSTVLSIEVGVNKIPGKRYAVNGASPLTFSLPVITKGGYKTLATVIHKAHADKFVEILKTIDINALTKEDMILIAKDFGFISRTQELAIDVAKDKTIEIVDTSEWLNPGVKANNFWLAKQDNVEGWYAKDNLNEIIKSFKECKPMPDFIIEPNVPEEVLDKIYTTVNTSESLAREALMQATKDYFNNTYKDMIRYSQETHLNKVAKSKALEYKLLSEAIRNVLFAYRSFVIDNIPKEMPTDIETSMLLNKEIKAKTNAFAKICRNTIYKLGETAGVNACLISLIAYGTDLIEVSKDEGKYFRAIMPEEFKKLYAKDKAVEKKEKLFFVDDFVKDMIDEGEEYVVNFVDGQAFDKDGILIAKASYKYNATNAKIVEDEFSGRYYAVIEENIELSPVGNEVLIRIENADKKFVEKTKLIYIPKTNMNNNVIVENSCGETFARGNFGYRSVLPISYKLMLLNNQNLNEYYKNNKEFVVEQLINNVEQIKQYNLLNEIYIDKIITVNQDNEDYKTDYAVIIL